MKSIGKGPIGSSRPRSSGKATSPPNAFGPVKKFFSVIELAERGLAARELDRAEVFLKSAEEQLEELERSQVSSNSEKQIAREKYTEVEQLYESLLRQEGRSES